MAKFSYNITKSRAKCENVRKRLNEYCEKKDEIFIDVNSLKNCWTDVAQEAYINRVENDKKIIDDVCNSLYQYQENIENFNNDFEKVFTDEGYDPNNLNIIYDLARVNSALSKLESIKQCTRNTYKQYITPYQYGYKYLIDEVLDDLNDFENTCNRIFDPIYNMNRRIDSLIENSVRKACSINQVEVDGKLLNITYTIQPILPNLQSNIQQFFKSNIDKVKDYKNVEKNKNNDLEKSVDANIIKDTESIDSEIKDISDNEYTDTAVMSNKASITVDSEIKDVSDNEYTDTAVMSNKASIAVDSDIKDVSDNEYTDTAVMNNIAPVETDFNSKMNIESSNKDGINIEASNKKISINSFNLEKMSNEEVSDIKKSVSFNSGELSSMNIGKINSSNTKSVGDLGNNTLQNVNTNFEVNESVKHTDVSVNDLQQSSRVTAEDIMSNRTL